MSAFFIATAAVKDPAKFKEYGESVGATLTAFGGTPVLRGKAVAALSGELTHQGVAVIQFPDLDSIDAWYSSEAYQALIPLREAGADVTIISYALPN